VGKDHKIFASIDHLKQYYIDEYPDAVFEVDFPPKAIVTKDQVYAKLLSFVTLSTNNIWKHNENNYLLDDKAKGIDQNFSDSP
jgi:hypothetical protein